MSELIPVFNNYIKIKQIIPRKFLRDEVLTVATIKGLGDGTKLHEENETLVIQAKIEDVQFDDKFYIDELYNNKTEIELSDITSSLFKGYTTMYLSDYVINFGKLTMKFKPVLDRIVNRPTLQ